MVIIHPKIRGDELRRHEMMEMVGSGGYGGGSEIFSSSGIMPLLLGKAIDIDRMRVMDNYLLVQFPSYADEVVLLTDSGLYVDTTYHPYRYHPRCGRVIKGLLAGKQIFFSYLVFSSCRHYDPGYCLIAKEGVLYGIIPYEAVYCDEDKACYNGWVLCRPVRDESVKVDNGMTYRDVGGRIVVALPEARHRTEEAIVAGVAHDSALQAGQHVVMDIACDMPLESDYHRVFKEDYFIVEEKNIMLVKEADVKVSVGRA